MSSEQLYRHSLVVVLSPDLCLSKSVIHSYMEKIKKVLPLDKRKSWAFENWGIKTTLSKRRKEEKPRKKEKRKRKINDGKKKRNGKKARKKKSKKRRRKKENNEKRKKEKNGEPQKNLTYK